jgi:hypothetical protein
MAVVVKPPVVKPSVVKPSEATPAPESAKAEPQRDIGAVIGIIRVAIRIRV